MLTKDDLKEVARYIWDQVKYEPKLETFSDFLKRLKVIVKQAFQDNRAKFIQTILFGKMPIIIQQGLMNNNKEEASSKETKTFLHQRQQNHRFTQIAMPQPFHQASSNQTQATRHATQQQQLDVKRHTRRFEGNCFFKIRPHKDKPNADRTVATFKVARSNKGSSNHYNHRRGDNQITGSYFAQFAIIRNTQRNTVVNANEILRLTVKLLSTANPQKSTRPTDKKLKAT